MTICGIDIKGSEAIFAVATQGAHGLEHVAIATKKIALDDDENAAHVKAFAASIAAFPRIDTASPSGPLRSELAMTATTAPVAG